MGVNNESLATTLSGIGTWTTRLWLADRATAGMNRAVADLAHGPGPGEGEDFSEHWLGRIRRLRNTRVGVPNDEEVREGIRTRKAYGGSATGSSFAVLCALMEAEHREEAPARNRLTIEHVMPQKLTDDWKRALGDQPEEKHGRHRDRLANLTLSGDATNSSMAAGTFAAKRKVYRNSSIGMTRRLADENEWNEEALERRAEDLTGRILDRWPWPDQTISQQVGSSLKWRIEDGPWHTENSASQMVLKVAGVLLSRNPANARRLSGESIRPNVHLAERYPPGTTVGTLTMRAIPGHDQYVLYPYERDYPTSAERCRKIGERCDVRIEVELPRTGLTQAFWEYLKKHMGGVPGQKPDWRGATQWTSPVNSSRDRIGIHVGTEWIWLYIRAGETQASEQRARPNAGLLLADSGANG